MGLQKWNCKILSRSQTFWIKFDRYFLYFANFANFAKLWVLNLAFREIPKARNFVHCKQDQKPFISEEWIVEYLINVWGLKGQAHCFHGDSEFWQKSIKIANKVFFPVFFKKLVPFSVEKNLVWDLSRGSVFGDKLEVQNFQKK